MLTLSKVKEVRRLLDEGELSQRKIAAKLGVSRGTVSALATGKRGDYGREPTEAEPAGPPTRCKTCGWLVYLPCVRCEALDYQRRLREPRHAA
ncbi:MAG: helix-turn-helix domain-containing protein [Planctomycetota bacterium]